MSGHSTELVVTRGDTEVRINLHPISLALMLAEVIEQAAGNACRKRGHRANADGWCRRCGVCLPDNGDFHTGAWLPEAWRSIWKAGKRWPH